MRIAETYNLVDKAIAEQMSNILTTLINSMIRKASISPAFAQIRVKRTTQRFFKLMKEANIEEVGIESSSENVLKSMRKYYPPDPTQRA